LKKPEIIASWNQLEREVLQWRWVKASSMILGARNRRGEAAGKPSQRLNRVYNCIESLSNKAALNGVVLSSASWFDENDDKKSSKKICETVSGKSAWKSVMNVCCAVREVK
jgi:hypothetical protein